MRRPAGRKWNPASGSTASIASRTGSFTARRLLGTSKSSPYSTSAAAPARGARAPRDDSGENANMAYLRGDFYVWADDDDRVHIWSHDGADCWRESGWAAEMDGALRED